MLIGLGHLRWNVLIQRASEGDIQHLGSAADTKHGQLARQGKTHSCISKSVRRGFTGPKRGWGSSP